MLRSILRNTAQHGIDQPGIARGAAVGAHQVDRKVDGGVVGHVEPEDLRRADQERGLGARRIGGHAAVEVSAEQVAQCAESAQHRGDQMPCQCAVAIGERREAGVGASAVNLLVQ